MPLSKAELQEFLKSDSRQLWALNKQIDELVYVEKGSADDIREFIKTECKCPMPDCDVPISVRGKSKRDHIYHLNPVKHDTESFDHYTAKMMLAQWVRETYPDYAVDVERNINIASEETVYRRPDVLVTTNKGVRVALEVEYKNFSEEAIGLKDKQLREEGIIPIWLIGHSRLKASREIENQIVFNAAGKRIASLSKHPLSVNPVTQEIGVVSKRDSMLNEHDIDWNFGFELETYPLTHCSLTSEGELRAPNMRRLEQAKAKRDAYRAKHKRIAEERRERQRAYEERSEKEATVVKEKLGRIPKLLSDHNRYRDSGCSLAPLSLHYAIIHRFADAYDQTFTVNQVIDYVKKHWEIYDQKDAFFAIMTFLERLRDAGFLEQTGRYSFCVLARVTENIDSLP